jgi:hypothetical protein
MGVYTAAVPGLINAVEPRTGRLTGEVRSAGLRSRIWRCNLGGRGGNRRRLLRRSATHRAIARSASGDTMVPVDQCSTYLYLAFGNRQQRIEPQVQIGLLWLAGNATARALRVPSPGRSAPNRHNCNNEQLTA